MKNKGMRDWMRENGGRFDDREKLVAEGMRRFHSTRKCVLDAICQLRKQGCLEALGAVARPAAEKPRRNGKNMFRLSVDVAEIKREYDEEAKILEGIKALGTRLIKDNDFRMELDVPIDRWKVVSALSKLAPYKKELKGKRFRGLYWGSPEVIKELAKKIDMLP